MEEMHGARYMGEGVQSFHALSRAPLSQHLHKLTTCKFSEPQPLGILVFFTQSGHWPMAIDSTFSLSPRPIGHGWGGGCRTESPSPPLTRLVPLATNPHPQVLSKRQLINITKDTFFTVNTQEIPRLQEAVSQELCIKTKYVSEIYSGCINGQIYISYKPQYCNAVQIAWQEKHLTNNRATLDCPVTSHQHANHSCFFILRPVEIFLVTYNLSPKGNIKWQV